MSHMIKDWLGVGRNKAVVGLHLSQSHLSLAVVRPGPLRLTALGRHTIQEAAVVNDEVRLAVTLAADLAQMVERLGLPRGVGVVAAIEPRDATFQALDGETSTPCPVRQVAHDRLVGAIHGAGLKLLRVDPVPAALARLARLAQPQAAALRGGYRWTVVSGDGFTEAERSTHNDDARLRLGFDLASVQPFEQPPLKVARNVRSIVDLDRDAVAIGAALAGLDMLPLVDVQPVAEGRGGDWAMQQVAGPSPAVTGRPGQTLPGQAGPGRAVPARVDPQDGASGLKVQPMSGAVPGGLQ